MKKYTIYFLLVSLFMACSSVKTTQKAINEGNYEKAINLAVKNLRKNKTKKGNQSYIPMLEDAFRKASQRDEERITLLKKDANPENLETIYNLYLRLDKRQYKIKPLLPLKSTTTGIPAAFNFKDYNDALVEAKIKLTERLYAKSQILLSSSSKGDYRKAYDELSYIERINPNYKNTRVLIEEAHAKGTDYVYVSLKNRTRRIIPKRLSRELLNFNTYGLEDLWTVYHNRKYADVNYDFELELTFRNITISPEQIREKQLVREKEIKDGWKFKVDKNGDFVLDADGNKIKVDKLINVRCELFQVQQFKTASLRAQVKFLNYNSKQVLKTFPLRSRFTFEHYYATYRGDRRALDTSLREMTRVKALHFPTNEQMVFDAGNDLKQRLKRLIRRNKFRK